MNRTARYRNLEHMLLDDFSVSRLPPIEYSLVRVARRAMATTFEVAIPAGTHAEPIAAAEDALNLIDQLEDQLTIYRDHSEVSQLNATAGSRFVQVEAGLFDLLSRCAVWTRESGAAFDIAAGALTRAWAIARNAGRIPHADELIAAMNKSGTRHLMLDESHRAVKFRVPGLELNLGAVGKGYALDRAAELLRTRWGIRSALLHAGGSSAAAIGAPPGEPDGWPVRLRHPAEAEQSLGVVHLRDAGLGTSAATYQFFEYNGRKLGHVLDPRTGWPVTCTASANVVAPTAAEADAMSTAAFVLGASGAEYLTGIRPALKIVVLPASDTTEPLSFNFAEYNYAPPGANQTHPPY